MTGVANSIVDNLNKNLKLLLHGVFYVNAHLLVGHNGTPLLPPHKLHLNIKYTTLSLTMIIKQPLSFFANLSSKISGVSFLWTRIACIFAGTDQSCRKNS